MSLILSIDVRALCTFYLGTWHPNVYTAVIVIIIIINIIIIIIIIIITIIIITTLFTEGDT